MKTTISNTKQFVKQLFLFVFTILLTTTAFAQVTPAEPAPPVAAPNWGGIIKAKDKNGFARVFQGAVHIGPTTDHPTDAIMSYASVPALEDALLFVEGGIATENMTYIFADDWDLWPDYVFDEKYKSISLDDLETYIKQNKHLPEVISQQEVKENGVNDRKMSITLLKKIEELTLYTIEQHKSLKEQKELNTSLMQGLKTLEEKVNNMSNQK